MRLGVNSEVDKDDCLACRLLWDIFETDREFYLFLNHFNNGEIQII